MDDMTQPLSDRELRGLRGPVRECTEHSGTWSSPTLVFDREGKLVQPDSEARSRLVREEIGPGGRKIRVEDVSVPGRPGLDVSCPAPCADGIWLSTRGAAYAVTTFSETGRPVRTDFTSAAGAVLARAEYEYGEAGGVVGIVEYVGDELPPDAARIAGMIEEASRQSGAEIQGEVLQLARRFGTAGSELSRISLQYDGAGRVIERVDTALGVPMGNVKYGYNERGDMAWQEIDGDRTEFSYEYDSAGNWVRHVATGRNSSIEAVRAIRYYD